MPIILFRLAQNCIEKFPEILNNIQQIKDEMKGQSNMDFKKLEKFLSRQKVSFICSIDSENFPNVKAMLKPRKHIGVKEFYFSTNTSSMRVKQYQENPNASIYFYHKGLIKYEGLMLVGKMEVISDQKIKSEIWRRGDKMFYKKGVTDPDYCVLKFSATKGRYYCDLKTENLDGALFC